LGCHLLNTFGRPFTIYIFLSPVGPSSTRPSFGSFTLEMFRFVFFFFFSWSCSSYFWIIIRPLLLVPHCPFLIPFICRSLAIELQPPEALPCPLELFLTFLPPRTAFFFSKSGKSIVASCYPCECRFRNRLFPFVQIPGSCFRSPAPPPFVSFVVTPMDASVFFFNFLFVPL